MVSRLEHVNISVKDPKATAGILTDLFGWHIRWEGAAMNDGVSVHVGTKDSYIALYSPGHEMQEGGPKYRNFGSLNHIGLVVDDLDAEEAKVRAAGFNVHSYADYEPGRRFYFDGPDGVEYEIVSYT